MNQPPDTSGKQTGIQPLLFDSYLATVLNAVGSSQYRSFYAMVNGQKRDVLEGGELSCAVFASTILTSFHLTPRPHATVNAVIEDLECWSWEKISKPRVGAVLVWAPHAFEDGEMHRHIGFYVAEGQAVSNSTTTRTPALHSWTFGRRGLMPARKVEAIYWHRFLDDPMRWSTWTKRGMDGPGLGL